MGVLDRIVRSISKKTIKKEKQEVPVKTEAMKAEEEEIRLFLKGIDIAREHFARFGIRIERGTVLVPCKKREWEKPMVSDLCMIRRNGNSYNVVVHNLPYFLGPNWREMSGGKPLALECESIDEVMELLQTAIVARMANGFLPVL